MEDFYFDDLRLDTEEKFLYYIKLKKDWEDKNLIEKLNYTNG